MLRMMQSHTGTFRRTAQQCFFGSIALALVTVACVRLEADLPTTALVYLAVIVLLSLIGSYVASLVLIIFAVAGLAYFFAPPVFSSATDLPQDIALAIVFLLTPLTVTGLVRRARQLTVAARKAEVLAKQAESELRLAINTIPALVWSTSPDGSLDFINQRWEEIGLSLNELRGSEWIKVLHPNERAGVEDRWRTAVETGTAYENIERVRRADGEYRWFLSRAQPLRDELGRIVKWFGVDSDIEDQKRAEDALRESEQRFRDYTESASDWYWETGPDHRFTTVTEPVGTLGGLSTSRIGTLRWESARDLEEEPEKWRLHMADLDAHKPFRDFRYRAIRAMARKSTWLPAVSRYLMRKDVSSVTGAWPATWWCARSSWRKHCRKSKVVGDNIAHDLRTPLTRVRMRLERGRDRASTLEELRAIADQAIAGLDESLTTITALLRITEIEHGRRRQGLARFDSPLWWRRRSQAISRTDRRATRLLPSGRSRRGGDRARRPRSSFRGRYQSGRQCGEIHPRGRAGATLIALPGRRDRHPSK